jgi:hypothetical protein
MSRTKPLRRRWRSALTAIAVATSFLGCADLGESAFADEDPYCVFDQVVNPGGTTIEACVYVAAQQMVITDRNTAPGVWQFVPNVSYLGPDAFITSFQSHFVTPASSDEELARRQFQPEVVSATLRKETGKDVDSAGSLCEEYKLRPLDPKTNWAAPDPAKPLMIDVSALPAAVQAMLKDAIVRYNNDIDFPTANAWNVSSIRARIILGASAPADNNIIPLMGGTRPVAMAKSGGSVTKEFGTDRWQTGTLNINPQIVNRPFDYGASVLLHELYHIGAAAGDVYAPGGGQVFGMLMSSEREPIMPQMMFPSICELEFFNASARE